MCSSATPGLPENEEARGAQGVPLTATRSIAVDRVLHVYGTPFFIEAELPIATETSNTKFRRLMIAQDTGSAIVGPARADIYFGAGDEAGKIAGRIKNTGALHDADAARARSARGRASAMPLPAPRPASAPKPAEARGGAERRPRTQGGRTEARRAAAAPAAEIMTRRRSLSEDERTLWETVTRAVAPLRRRKTKASETVAANVVAAPLPPGKQPRKTVKARTATACADPASGAAAARAA